MSIDPNLIPKLQVVFKMASINEGTPILRVPAHVEGAVWVDEAMGAETTRAVIVLNEMLANHVLNIRRVRIHHSPSRRQPEKNHR